MSKPIFTATMAERLEQVLKLLKLPAMAVEIVNRFEQAGYGEALAVLLELCERELAHRVERRLERRLRDSKLPSAKTFESFDERWLPSSLLGRLHELRSGEFLDRAVNVLLIGPSASGKTHAASALGHALVQAGRSVLFVPAYQLVEQLLLAKRQLTLARALRKLDSYELIVLDDLGSAPHNAEQAEVLFTLVAERFERRSLLITSRFPLSGWQRVFGKPVMATAALDRLVHHSVILEFRMPSCQLELAATRRNDYPDERQRSSEQITGERHKQQPAPHGHDNS
jgi:DNA replication protein DnaC